MAFFFLVRGISHLFLMFSPANEKPEESLGRIKINILSGWTKDVV